ncbi:F-box/LRR-repeat protein 3-like [Physella acuta]|uniref:F-box/LRR-repeat protein 3-like n=1 Tax=Physella acuta TaxID=109671 RepID=UPI0027DE4F4C|nr:F-box/LRR-repeat protein 3-like [Physella acuta]
MDSDGSREGYFHLNKRFKPDTDQTILNVDNLDSSGESSTEQSLFTEADWSRLPYLVLVQVFQHLDQTDRYHAALTCKSWLLALSSPAVWRTGHFKLNTKYDKYLLIFIRRMGKSFLHIRADGTAQTDRGIRYSIRFLYHFIEALLTANNQQLVTLSLTDMKILELSSVHHKWEVVEQLAILIENQRNLQVLNLSHADLSIDEGFRLLEAAASHRCHKTIHTLDIDRLIDYTQAGDFSTDKKFYHYMSRFSNLSDLELSQLYLSDELLYQLAETASFSLRLITIREEYVRLNRRQTTSTAWQYLKSACPNCKVETFINPRIGRLFDFSVREILTPSMPLHTLNWNCGRTADTDTFQLCMQHIADNFQDSLRHLHIFFWDVPDKKSLLDLIKRCHNLETLSVRTSNLTSGLERRIETDIKLGLACHHSSTHPCVATLNHKDVSLKDTWQTTIFCWLAKLV